ncbi:MAG: InlB B-repeat-containing protein, partial [Lachnospiraceae bacterium]|nr:InlB B-repeat-containing protein [Lachnospiraceae bacterium]
MRRAKRITALAVAAAMVLSNVAYAAPDTNTTTTQQGAESLNSQSDASGGVKDQASDTKGNTNTSASQSKEQVKQNESSQSTDPGDQKQTDSKADAVSQNQDQKKDEDSKETQKPSTEADSQKSETQNVDADKSEDTQEPSKEQEKVLYDITFDTPEKHGRVTDLDGKEVADGKTLKTDENGKAKFKVKPDAGYQVQAVYQMPDEQTPLKLVKDSYYEMQVEKNTTVKVVYQKIPAKENDGDNQNAEEEVVQKNETEQEENSVNGQETTEPKPGHQEEENTYQDEKQTDASVEKETKVYEVYVGKTIQITGKAEGAIPQHKWMVEENEKAVQLSNSDKQTVKIEGLEAKENIEIIHQYKGLFNSSWETEKFYVSVKSPELEKIQISGSSDMVIGTMQTLSAVLLPEEYDHDAELAWSSTEPEVASVDQFGNVTAKKLGTTTITACVGKIVSNPITITVTDKVEAQNVIITSEFDRVYVGGSKTMTAYVSPSTTTDKTLTWSVSDPSKAMINATTGTITGLQKGSVTVTVRTQNGKTDSKIIQVVQPKQDKIESVYFYGIKQGKDPTSLNGDDYFYIGLGQINTEGLYVPNGSSETENVNDYIISSPSDKVIKDRVAEYYDVSDPDKVKITYSFYKITHPNGWTDENGTSHDSTKPCYHVDMDISVETLNQASVTFSLKDAGQTSFELRESFMVDKGTRVSPAKEYPEQKVVDGVTYYFDGWYDNPECYGAKVTIPYTVNEASRLYAQYVAQQYTLTYNSNGGQGTAPEGGRFASGTEAEVSKADGLTREGYTFVEWNTSPNGTGNGYQPGSSLVFKNSDITLYAIWKRDTSGFSVEGVNTTYDGKSHTISIAGNLLVGEKWQYKDGNRWKDAETQNGQFGNYVNAQNTSVEFRVVHEDNDVIWTNIAQVNIQKASITVTDTKTENYDGTEKVLNLTADKATGV